MPIKNASKQILAELLQWQGLETHPHRFGGMEFRIGKREIGHLHGDALVDTPFPKKVRDEIVAAGVAKPHHILPDSGWVSSYMNDAEDVEGAIELLRRSYELALRQRCRKVTDPDNAIPPRE